MATKLDNLPNADWNAIAAFFARSIKNYLKLPNDVGDGILVTFDDPPIAIGDHSHIFRAFAGVNFDDLLPFTKLLVDIVNNKITAEGLLAFYNESFSDGALIQGRYKIVSHSGVLSVTMVEKGTSTLRFEFIGKVTDYE